MNEMHDVTHLRQLGRADAYRLLSACFYQPEVCFLEEEVFDQLKLAMARAGFDREAEVSALEEHFRSEGSEALTLDYSRLFLGPFDILAKPYGSVYLDGDKVVMGDSTLRALALYREGGFEVAGDFREVADHVSVELEFLYLLSLRLGQMPDAGEQSRLTDLKRKFLTEHLGRWVGKLTEAMRDGAETEFYRLLGVVTEKFVLEDMREISRSG